MAPESSEMRFFALGTCCSEMAVRLLVLCTRGSLWCSGAKGNGVSFPARRRKWESSEFGCARSQWVYEGAFSHFLGERHTAGQGGEDWTTTEVHRDRRLESTLVPSILSALSQTVRSTQPARPQPFLKPPKSGARIRTLLVGVGTVRTYCVLLIFPFSPHGRIHTVRIGKSIDLGLHLRLRQRSDLAELKVIHFAVNKSRLNHLVFVLGFGERQACLYLYEVHVHEDHLGTVKGVCPRVAGVSPQDVAPSSTENERPGETGSALRGGSDTWE